MKSATQRFWSKVQIGAECWTWTATRQSCGYGHFWHNGRMEGAHRFAWKEANGPIPEGMTIDHLCKVRHCVNPAHMDVVTLKENLRRSDGACAINGRKTHCSRGHPFDDVNTGQWRNERYCKACRRGVRARASVNSSPNINQEPQHDPRY